MKEDDNTLVDKAERRLQAILALLQGQPAAHVQHQYHLGRSALYKFKRRALAAMRTAVVDHKKGPRTPANKLSMEKEQQVQAVCERYPTWSFYSPSHKGFVPIILLVGEEVLRRRDEDAESVQL